MTRPVKLVSLFSPPLVLMGFIFYLSSQPDLNSGLGVWDLIGRKIAHMVMYGLLAAAWYRALATMRALPKYDLMAAIVLSALYAVSDEIHQSFVHGRHGTPIDVTIDFVGISVAAYLIIRLRGRWGWH